MYPNKISSFTSHLSRSSKIRILFPFISEFSSFNNKMESKSQVTLPSSFPSPSMSYFKAIFEAAFNIFLASFIPLLYSHGDISLLICSVICWVVVKPYKDTYMGRHFNLSASLSFFSCFIHWRIKNVLPHPQAPRSMMAYCGSGISAYSFKKVSMFLFIAMFIRGFKITEKSHNSDNF